MRSDATRRVWLVAAGFVLLSAFHLGTLGLPSPTSPLFDEVSLTDAAAHGQLSLWKDIIPPDHRNLLDRDVVPLWGGYTATQGWILKWLGVSFVTSKLGPALCGLLGLAALLLTVETLRLPWPCSAAALAFGLTGPFFGMEHSARPEGYVFLAGMLNWYRLARGGGRASALAAGFLAAAALSFHQAALFTLVAVPATALTLLHDEEDLVESGVWWTTGALAGLLLVFEMLDADRSARSLLLSHAASAPPLLLWWSRPQRIVARAFQYFFFISKQGAGWHALMCGALVVSWHLFRERARLPRGIKLALGAWLSTATALSLLSASGNGSYYLVYPAAWIVINLAVGLVLLWRGELKLTTGDRLALAALLGAVLAASYGAYASLFAASLALAALARSGIPLRARLAILAAAAAGAVAVAALAPDHATIAVVSMVWYALSYRPQLLAWLVLLPWAIYPPRRLPLSSGDVPLRLERLLTAYAVLAALAVMTAQARWLRQQHDLSRLTQEQRARVAGLRATRRLIAPAELWFYDPSIQFQSAEALIQNDGALPLARTLIDYRPAVILWPIEASDLLERRFAETRPGSSLRRGDVWLMPSREWQAYTLLP